MALGIGIAAGVGALALPAGAAAKPVKVKVMTRNVFLGADLGPALTQTTQIGLYEEAAKILEEVRETNFSSRSRMLAAEIADANPHIVGLQEVALWRRGPKGEADGPATPAEGVVYDFLQILRGDLRDLGAKYRVAVVQEETDFEAPLDDVDDDQLGDGGDPSNMRDGRLTMRDVILVRRGVRFTGARGAHYNIKLPLDIAPAGAGPEDFLAPRGWTKIEANVNGARFRLVNTHLEAFHPGVRKGQASELVFAGGDNPGPAVSRKPVVLLGDLNSDDDLVETDPGAIPADEEPYALIRSAGFVERSVDVPGIVDDEFACCYPEMDDPDAIFTHNVDHVMVDTPSIGLVRSFVTGDDGMTPDGLWPSDHGGIVSVLKMRR
jgi:endonuclease/exonuclease/phosphatase family metal-dependent hydrolase